MFAWLRNHVFMRKRVVVYLRSGQTITFRRPRTKSTDPRALMYREFKEWLRSPLGEIQLTEGAGKRAGRQIYIRRDEIVAVDIR